MTRAPVDVRQARPGDVDDLLGLWVQARAEVQGAGRPLLGPVPELLRPRLVEALSRRDDVHILLARWEGRAAGFALVRVGQLLPVLEADCVQLEHLYVTPALRRHGIAKALLAGVAGLAESHGADQILGGAPPSAREVHRFLARLGFTPLVLRRVVATATLRRRLAGESKRSALEDLLSRRRSLRARSVRAATPPRGLPLDTKLPDTRLPDTGGSDTGLPDTLELALHVAAPAAPGVEVPCVVPAVELPTQLPAQLPVEVAVDVVAAVPAPSGARRSRRRAAPVLASGSLRERPGELADDRAPGPAASA